MSVREMPMVPREVAVARQCPEAGELAMTRRHLIRDAKAESKPVKTMAFGTAIAWEFQFVPPRNRVRERWLQCENVMPDLETMDVVWKGITHLESVRAFSKWLYEHPKVGSLHEIGKRSPTSSRSFMFQVWSPDELTTAISTAKHIDNNEIIEH